MTDAVARHYQTGGDLVRAIADALRTAGKDPARITAADLAGVDEFHVRGRAATLELAGFLRLDAGSRLLDIGSGLGGPARAMAEACGCHVTGIDLTPAYCAAATALSAWVGLADRVDFSAGDATALPFADAAFDAAMTIHVAMNIAAKDRMYAEARRVLKPGGRFVAYDILQGEGGEVLYPVPWARTAAISHLATPGAMAALLEGAGFTLLETHDSTAAGQLWFERLAARGSGRAAADGPALTPALLLGDDFAQMARNQVANLRERRIRTVTFVCAA
ncbi:methyltransferase domain-containing protein [Xanthobacter sp. KR7-225]|uniref:SAM-dependent methyltransferase n=1 Tax=Xanthobacter sp. KR7-225 TaxID=3156613 RepID=UPI0032B43DA6